MYKKLSLFACTALLIIAGLPEPIVSQASRPEKTAYQAHAQKQKLDVDGTLKDIACRYEIDWKHLKAICTIESNCDSTAIGDTGKALGAFQIHTGHNPEVTSEQAFDFRWSAEWTAKRLVSHGYLEQFISRSIAKHNGSWKNPKVQRYVQKIRKVYHREKKKELNDIRSNSA